MVHFPEPVNTLDKSEKETYGRPWTPACDAVVALYTSQRCRSDFPHQSTMPRGSVSDFRQPGTLNRAALLGVMK